METLILSDHPVRTPLFALACASHGITLPSRFRQVRVYDASAAAAAATFANSKASPDKNEKKKKPLKATHKSRVSLGSVPLSHVHLLPSPPTSWTSQKTHGPIVYKPR